MNLALFDLDNTLLPIDSDHSWAQFLISLGVLDKALYEQQNDAFYADYKAGCLDLYAFLDFQLRPLACHPRAQLNAWHAQFMQQCIQPNIHPQAQALVDQHRAQGDICVLITATNHFITAPIAQAFGIPHLIATELEEQNGTSTGKPYGTPSFREGKVTRLEQWLHLQGHSLTSIGRSHFYSDSINDLPLLSQVSHPVATNPDAKLGELAQARGWPILHLFA